jgi:hypothetical protein
MSFDDEDTSSNLDSGFESDSSKKPKTFFGMELSDGVVYTIVIILTLIFIRQVAVVLQALNP